MKAYYPVRFMWKTVSKSLVYLFFVLGASVLITVVFPTILLFIHPERRSSVMMRKATSMTFMIMRWCMVLLGLVRVVIGKDDRLRLKNLSSSIIVANHPSLIDVTLLISYMPQADCIVNAKLFERPIVRHVVRRLFVPNSIDFSIMVEACGNSLAEGNCLVIFPEGTRTKPGREPAIKKGSARISLKTGYPVIPVRIEANDMRGLRKGDPFYRINRNGRYEFTLTVGNLIDPRGYAAEQAPVAAKKMTQDIFRALFPDAAAARQTEPR